METIEIATFKYKVDHESPTACMYYHIGAPHNGEYPIFDSDGDFAGTLTAEWIKSNYEPAINGKAWNGTF